MTFKYFILLILYQSLNKYNKLPPLQVQWTSAPQVNSPVSCQTQGLLSPTYGGATYSFTADFRPPQDSQVLSTSYKTVPVSFNSPRRRSSFDEDTQKPNICRICGKLFDIQFIVFVIVYLVFGFYNLRANSQVPCTLYTQNFT